MNQRNQKKQIGRKPQKTMAQKTATFEKVMWSGLGILLLIGISVGLYFVIANMIKKPAKEEKKRFEDLTHITLEQYQGILNGDHEITVGDEVIQVNHHVYIYVYNPDYDVCTSCNNLDALIQEAATKEGKTYSFFVLNASLFEKINETIEGAQLPNHPALVHIQGNMIGENGVSANELAIKSVLSKL